MIECPHCRKSIGGTAHEGGFRVRLGMLIIDPDSGDIHGPCPHCKRDVQVAEGASLLKSLFRRPARPSRRRLVVGVPVTGTSGSPADG